MRLGEWTASLQDSMAAYCIFGNAHAFDFALFGMFNSTCMSRSSYVPVPLVQVIRELLSQRENVDVQLASHAQPLSVGQCVRILPNKVQVEEHLILYTSGLLDQSNDGSDTGSSRNAVKACPSVTKSDAAYGRSKSGVCKSS